MIHPSFKLSLNKHGLLAAIDRKRRTVLYRAGAFAKTVMQRKLRPRKTRKPMIIVVHGRECLVGPRGKVLDAKTKRPVATKLAAEARIEWLKRQPHEAGQAPRRGPKDTLRKNIAFEVDLAKQQVAIGPKVFDRQPPLQGASSVVELLEAGGREWVRSMGKSVMQLYQPHPYAGPTLPIAEKKFRELIKTVPLK